MTEEGGKLETQIKDLHHPSGIEIDVKSLLHLVKSIISMISSDAQKKPEDIGKIRPLSLPWRQLCLAALEDTSEGVDNHTITLSVLKELTQFGWDAKAVMVLTTFALNHCLWMVAQMYSASSPALQAEKHSDLHTFLSSWLSKVSDVDPYYFYLSLIYSISKKPKANQLPKPALTKLFQALVDVVACIIDLEELPSADLQGNETSGGARVVTLGGPNLIFKIGGARYPASPPLDPPLNETQYEEAMADIPITVYIIITTVVYCTALIKKLPINDYEISGTEEDYLISTADQLNMRTKNFRDQIADCNRFLEETKVDKTYQIPLPNEVLKDNRKALEFLIKGGSDQQLQNEADKIITQLKGKHVMLLVSDDEILMEDLLIVDKFYNQITSHPLPVKSGREADELSILWIPLYSSLSKESTEYHFQTQKRLMKWFTVPHPSVVSEEATKFIKLKWQLQSQTSILVMLDPQGTVLNINAFHMISIWGGIHAFPYTRSKERALWKSTSFTMDFIIDGIDSRASEMIDEDKWLIIYGWDDIDWIRKFPTLADIADKILKIDLKGLYIGKPNHRIANNKIKKMIKEEDISYVLPDDFQEHFFWSRVRSMLISKMSHQKGSATEDWMTRQLKLLLGYETERKWALIGKGNKVVVHGTGEVVMDVMREFDNIDSWKWLAGYSINVEMSLKETFKTIVARRKMSCCEIEFPVRCTGMPETLKCPNPNCKLEEMERRIVFECCHTIIAPAPTKAPTESTGVFASGAPAQKSTSVSGSNPVELITDLTDLSMEVIRLGALKAGKKIDKWVSSMKESFT